MLVAEAAREPDDQTRSAPSLSDEPTRPGRLLRGTSLGRYLVLEPLGSGGLGDVYACYDPELDRRVAIKLLKTTAAALDRAQLRLKREAQALARLAHPNVVAVHDVGIHDDRVFVAMELVEGQTLRAWLSAEPRSWSEVRDVMVAAGRGLAAAHAAGMVHRDFKPGNMMVGLDGRVRVLDFGLARAVSPGSGSDAGEVPVLPPGSAGLAAGPAGLAAGAAGLAAGSAGVPGSAGLDVAVTQTGVVLGTPAYMAPEQLTGTTVDGRADQFGFCCTLYEALWGKRPF
ncbi:MAG: serine/threonine protein kinase, partial [Myxococcales bacterium]|nr:serine/threonine protein kinase [Myxococcales bacterium]